MRALVLALLATGCGRWNFDADRIGADAGALDAEGTCNAALPFGSPVRIDSLASAVADGTLRLARDELTGYFWSARSGRSEIYFASRSARTEPFTVAVVSGLSAGGNDLDPTLSTDGSVLVFRHSAPGDALWIATAADSTTFTGAMVITNLDSGAVETEPYLQPTGNDLYFQSTRTGSGDLYRSVRTGTTFTAPALVTELQTPAIEGDPVISEDGLTLYFRSNAPAALGGFNVYETNRATPASAFGPPVLLDGVSSPGDNGPSFLSPDHCRLYISSDRAGTNDIYVATRGT